MEITYKPEVVQAPHHELDYEQKPYTDFINFDWKKATKADAVSFARCSGLKETGMSVNELALLYDLLEKRRPKIIVELGRNFGCSTRIFLQYVARNAGAFLQSWDLKHWGNVRDTFDEMGFKTTDVGPEGDYIITQKEADNAERTLGIMRIAHSIKTPPVYSPCGDDRFVDFLLVDTEHGVEHALGEYMRWREYLCPGAMIAFHDSTLPGVKRAIELIKEVEEWASPGAGRILREYVNEREDGYGIQILEWKG